MENKLDLILTVIKGMHSEVSVIKNDIHSLKEGQERIEKRLDIIESKLASFTKREEAN